MSELNTFSIVARCARSGQLGVAVATAVPAVGSMCPYVVAQVGAVSTQSWVNPYLAIALLDRLAAGETTDAALKGVLGEDDARDLRQLGAVDRLGRAAAFTGRDCTPYAGHRVGDHFAVQGNMLVGPETLDAMVTSFESSPGEDLAERLVRALEDGDAAGGDKRGKQSSALKVFADQSYALLDLRVDEHPTPVAELRRILTVARHQLSPFVAGMPRRGAAAEGLPPDVAAMLLLSPAQRPGGTSGPQDKRP